LKGQKEDTKVIKNITRVAIIVGAILKTQKEDTNVINNTTKKQGIRHVVTVTITVATWPYSNVFSKTRCYM
jgi:hypothetical protein